MNARRVIYGLLSQISLCECMASAAEPLVWDFASGDGAWHSRAKTVAVDHTATSGATASVWNRSHGSASGKRIG